MAMQTSQGQLFNFIYIGWTLTVYGYTLLDNAGAHCPVRQKGNKLPPTEALQLFLIKIYKLVK